MLLLKADPENGTLKRSVWTILWCQGQPTSKASQDSNSEAHTPLGVILPWSPSLPWSLSGLRHIYKREEACSLYTSHLSSLSSLRPPTSRPVTAQNSILHLSLVSKHTLSVVFPPFFLHLKSTSSQHIQTCSSPPTLTRTFLP